MDEQLAKTLVELDEVFAKTDNKLLQRIPPDILIFIKNNKSKTYTFKYDVSKKLIEQSLSSTTKEILASLWRKYMCSLEEKRKYIQERNKLIMEEEEKKKMKYNPNNLFKKK